MALWTLIYKNRTTVLSSVLTWPLYMSTALLCFLLVYIALLYVLYWDQYEVWAVTEHLNAAGIFIQSLEVFGLFFTYMLARHFHLWQCNCFFVSLFWTWDLNLCSLAQNLNHWMYPVTHIGLTPHGWSQQCQLGGFGNSIHFSFMYILILTIDIVT